MFDNLQTRLGEIFRRLSGRGALKPEDVDAALREVRMALLEADVHFTVARDFVARVREAAVGQEIWKSLSPAQQVIKIVHEELARTLGGVHRELRFAPKPPTVLMLVGLHGTGKTTTAAKLAHLLRRRGRNPLLVATDLRRPAAVQQLEVVGRAAGVATFSQPGADDPVAVARAALAQAARAGHDVVIIDSAGRLHLDEELMAELARMREAVAPTEVLLTLDAMTGQDAVTMAEQFTARVGVDGLILTKLDGDARGGAALSVVAVTGRPILFAGVGERVEALEPFHPDRMASRILGMGDVLTLIEKAEATMSAEAAATLERKLRRGEWTLSDFVEQLRQVRTMGPLDQLVEMIPGLGGRLKGAPTVDERQLARVEAMINSMTPEERRTPALLNGSRRRRIARGAGVTVQEVNRLLKQFEEAKALVRQMEELGKRGKRLPKGGLGWPSRSD
ncbi:MAG: signal recognition particle protein [Armatimonadetes bacterium]|nr:signal recognition particle protein [Armatimonadota bacterium]